MELLLLLLIAGAAVVVVPLLLLKALFCLVLLPFKLLGGALHLLGALIGFVFKALFSVFGMVAFVLTGLLLLVALPLLPFLIVGGLVWLVVRPSRDSSARRLTA